MIFIQVGVGASFMLAGAYVGLMFSHYLTYRVVRHVLTKAETPSTLR